MAGQMRLHRNPQRSYCFPYAIGPSLPWEVASGIGLLEQPGDVLAEGLHGSQAVFILLDFVFGRRMSYILMKVRLRYR